MHTIQYTKENTMNYKEQGLKVLKEELEKLGASKHDIDVTLAFNDTAVDNLHTFISNLDNPLLAQHTLRVLSKLYNVTSTAMYLFTDEGDTNK